MAGHATWFVPADLFRPLDLAALFPNPHAPLELDVGSGNGRFAIEMARRYHDRNFLALERQKKRVRRTCEKAAKAPPPNLRILHIESGYAIRHLVPPGSVARVHILFPDPWPKRRHHKHRLLQPEFFSGVWRALAPGGRGRILTDHEDYYNEIRVRLRARTDFRELPWDDDDDRPRTAFETRFLQQAVPIYRIQMEKA